MSHSSASEANGGPPQVRTPTLRFIIAVSGYIPDTEVARARVRELVEGSLVKAGVAVQAMAVKYESLTGERIPENGGRP